MAYIFKSIAATHFLLNILFMYFFVNCNIFKFYNCCSMYKWVMATLLLLLVKMWKITNILKTVRDTAISSKFLIHRVVQDSHVKWGKISIFATFGGHLGFSQKMEKCQYLEKTKTVRDRAISSEFFIHSVVQQCPVERGEISIFTTFGGHLGF